MPNADIHVIQIPVKKYEVNLSLHDILTPLTQLSNRLAQGAAPPTPGSELHKHIQDLTDLTKQLIDVVTRINDANPSLLSPITQERPNK